MKTGIVVKTTGSWHRVKVDNGHLQCKLRGSFRHKSLKITNPLAVGDIVDIEQQDADTGNIIKIHRRKNYIIRKSTNLSRESQIMAANIDQVILMFTLDYPETPLEFVDRFLIAAEAYHIPCILVINKTDLYSTEKLHWMEQVKAMYAFAGYPLLEISVTQEININQVREILNRRLTLIAGNSGIGKSSLINLLCPGIHLKTNDISWYHEAGKHTTTYPEMIGLSENTFVIDSPGIRGFGLTGLNKNEIGLYFTDVFKLSRNCQFSNCTHIHEPRCAVLKAYQNGILHESRYRSYFNIFNDTDDKYRTG